MDDSLFGQLFIILWALMAFLPALLIEKLTSAFRHLPDKALKRGLYLRRGLALGFLVSLFYLISGAGEGQDQALFWGLGALAETGLKLLVVLALLQRRGSAQNSYDGFQYSVSLGMGYALTRSLFMALGGEMMIGFQSTLFEVLRQWALQALMGSILSKRLKRGEDLSCLTALLWPAALAFAFGPAFNAPGPFGGLIVTASAVLALLLALGLSRGAAAENAGLPTAEAGEPLPGLREQMAYRFDNLMAGGNLASIGLLFLICVLVIPALALLIFWKAPGAVSGKLSQALWTVTMRMLDGGNLSPDLAVGNRFFTSLTFLATLFGLVAVSVLVGLIGNALGVRLDDLKHGRARIVEHKHLLFLGYSPQVPELLYHLMKRRRGGRIAAVVMDERPQEEIEKELRGVCPPGGKIKLICRSGDITEAQALGSLSLNRARHVVISGEDGRALACALAVRQLLSPGKGRGPELTLLLSREAERLAAERCLGEGFKMPDPRGLSYKPLLRALRDRRLLPVYSALLTQDQGCILSSRRVKRARGLPFYRAAEHFRFSSAYGLLRGEELLVPPAVESLIQEEDLILFLKSPGDRLGFAELRLQEKALEPLDLQKSAAQPVKRLIILGSHGLSEIENELCGLPLSIDKCPRYEWPGLEERLKGGGYELVICLPEEGGDERALLSSLMLIRAVLPKGVGLCVRLSLPEMIRHSYQHDLADYVLEDRPGGLAADYILEDRDSGEAVREKLMDEGTGLRLLEAPGLEGQGTLSCAALCRALAPRGLSLLGFYRAQGKEKAVLAPNKNENFTLEKGDCLVVIGALNENKGSLAQAKEAF